MRVWLGFCFLLLLLPALVYGGFENSRLLRSDPDTIPQRPALMDYAVRAGAGQYAASCQQCHGGDGTGNTAHGVPNLTDGDWLYGSGAVSEIERIIDYGIRSGNPKAWNLARMPAYGRLHPSATNPTIPPLDPRQIHDVIEYLFLLQGRALDHDATVRGASIYDNVGGCYDCHSPDARGDPAIGAPNLVDKTTLYGDGSRDALYDSIANGRQGVCPAWIDKIDPSEVRATALYVYSLSHPASTAGRVMPR